MIKNPLSLVGIDFVEFSTREPEALNQLLFDFGFSKIARHKSLAIDLFRQNEIYISVNSDLNSFGGKFQSSHGPSISAMGWKFTNAAAAHEQALARGATNYTGTNDPTQSLAAPAVFGIGKSLIYFTEPNHKGHFDYARLGFAPLKKPVTVPDKGFIRIDHLTNNVFKGTMQEWATFYKSVFGFDEVRYFDIRGQKTGLTSYALRSPCGTFCIPINEADEAKSQINEYLEEYNGPGIQHLAFLTNDLLESIRKLEPTPIRMLDIDPHYYETVFERVPNVKESHAEIKRLSVLVDGDDEGYLLQIFTKNLVGPIFVELIQRANHLSFGEGNFQALFDSIERDQIRRGVLT